MLNVENFETYGWESAIRGMRNPMNSWDKSDSGTACKKCKSTNCQYCDEYYSGHVWKLGENDLGLLTRLCHGGSDDRKVLRQIFVSVDITAPLYWWKEMDQYKVGTVTNSCSTMHKIASKEFTKDDFSAEHLTLSAEDVLKSVIEALNFYRAVFLKETDQIFKKMDWWQMIQLLPSSYNQRRTWTANYEVLVNIYNARHNHKLDEWHIFCDAIRKLPYMDEILKAVNHEEEDKA